MIFRVVELREDIYKARVVDDIQGDSNQGRHT
jgi:hypothetical protein